MQIKVKVIAINSKGKRTPNTVFTFFSFFESPSWGYGNCKVMLRSIVSLGMESSMRKWFEKKIFIGQ